MTDDAPAFAQDRPRRALVLGHLSTVGDIEVLDWLTARLERLGVPYDVAAYSAKLRKARPGWVDGRAVDPAGYSHLVMVCGPFDPSLYQAQRDLFARFAHCKWVGLNLTMVAPVGQLNPFDVLLERDSDRLSRPDLSLVERPGRVPVLGLCLAGRQREYGSRQQMDVARRKLLALAERRSAAVVEIDTKWPASRNRQGLGSPAEFESVCARVDVLLTTRLHGMVLALKNGVPVVALDSIRGGGKVLQQAGALGWPEAFEAEAVSDEALTAALERCLDPVARDRALACAGAARESLGAMDAEIARAMEPGAGPRDLRWTPMLELRRRWTLARERFGRRGA